MCVLEILVLKIFKLRDYFERLLCWLDHWLSCMLDCIHVWVYLLSKNCFEKLAWHLLDTLLSIELLKPFSYRNPDSSSIPGGSTENAPASSIASRHLVDRSSFYSWIWFLVARHLLDTSAVDDHFLDTYLERFSTPASVEIYWGSIYTFFAILFSFLQSLSICPRLFISQTLSLSFQTSSSRFLQAFSSSSTLGKLLISHSSCISCSET